MKSTSHRAASAGLGLFVALSFLGSWFVAATLRIVAPNLLSAPLGTRLFAVSLLYAGIMGWQPLVATWVVRRWVDPPDRLDLGLRPCRRAFGVLGAAAAIAFAAAAAVLAWASGDLFHAGSLQGTVELAGRSRSPSLAELIALILAFMGTLVLIWAQAFTEEIAWRGYFLPRAMERFGRWGGLVLHGAVWGLWYTPVLLFASHGPAAPFGSLVRGAGPVLSCVLIGILFGWLRLASRSVVPVIVANATLTLAAGLPYIVFGGDAGLRSAAFGPAGWIVLAVVIAVLIATPWRALVQIPKLPAPAAEALLPSPHPLQIRLIIGAPEPPRDKRTLN